LLSARISTSVITLPTILDKLTSHSFMVLGMLLCFGVMGLLFMVGVQCQRRDRRTAFSVQGNAKTSLGGG
jgi:hypothetical protein